MKLFVEISEPDPLFVCPAAEEKHINAIESIGFKCTVIDNDKQSLNPLSSFQYYKKLFKLLKDSAPDDVFVFHMLPIISASRACRILGIRCHCLFAGLGYVFSNDKSFKRKVAGSLVKRVMRSCMKDVTTIFFQNPDDCQTFKQNRMVSGDTNVVVVNGSGVALDHFPQCKPKVGEKVIFLLVARILRDKGIPEFYAATKRLKKKWGDRVESQLLGPFDDNPNAMQRSQIEEWDREGIVKYLGVTDDVRPYLREAHVFTLPSFYMEGTPKIILETLSTGRAIITADSRGCRETIDNGRNGYLVAPRDVDSLADAMEQFLEHPELIVEMGAASRAFAESRYDVHKVNAEMIESMGFAKTEAET
ncbi:N,N'-diacetylbacillosaminyl-diphospho-undecaprenol alpha-1,3-N-acetylgalactosaminyltransferase [Mariniblastus fucicola]|uniref:N, N'-diacetylbacillosaminyl-diphospho-undecaprenol alpha-1,3-N-acetylgalactosaminyltransferase n=3 Tax=Mariniblastus fucicola TaxID=980251 RepID=A0A5B9PB00_9BACT|nr:N,N'-diacetylbacillosaminyl-diphospho-undecaprenol alpha-1,3-N-acetylgalactosaminyltransferase [Mariniblastus fucicola]